MTVVPTGNRFPDGTAERVIVTGPALSVAVTVPVSLSETPQTGAGWLLVRTVRFAGAVICGGFVSMTVIVCVAAALLPLPSVAVYMRMMTSGLAGDPEPPLFDSLTVIATGPQLSLAVASPALAA